MYKLSTAPWGKPIGLLLALLIAAWIGATPARAANSASTGDLPRGTYLLAPEHSQLVVHLRVFGVSHYPVSFHGLAGRMEAPEPAASVPRVTIRVDPRSVNNPRSAVARSMLTLLEPDRYPQIDFASRAFGDADGEMWLLGDLTLHGVTRPVRLTLTLQPVERAPGGRDSFTVYGRGRIRRSDFGMPQNRTLVSDQVDLTFEAEFVQAPTSAVATPQPLAPHGLE